MKKVGIFMADGCEEIEGLTVVDIVRRAKLEMTTISITDKREVTSSHNVTFLTDALASEVDFDGFDAIVLPGGMPGTLNLGASETVNKVIKKFAGEGKLLQRSVQRRVFWGQQDCWKEDMRPAIRDLRKN